MNITRDQAICMLFCEEYSKENAARLSRKIEDFGSFDVCYENDPMRPVLVHLNVIRSDPFTFKRYVTEYSAPDLKKIVEVKSELGKHWKITYIIRYICFNAKIFTVSELQVITFLNEVYRTTDPQNETLYCLQKVTIKEIFESAISKTECMSKKSEVAFASWCSKRKINFMDVPFTRKRDRGSNKRYRELYVMKNEYRGNVPLVFFFKKNIHVFLFILYF